MHEGAKVEESPVFNDLVRLDLREKTPAAKVFTQAWRRLLVAIAAAFLGVGGFYVMNTFVVSYASNTLGVARQTVVNATLVAAVVQIAVILSCGRLAERFGPGRVTFWGGLATAAAALPLFWLIDTGSPAAIVFAVTTGIALVTTTYAVTGALLSELFPPELRYTGFRLATTSPGRCQGSSRSSQRG